MANDILYNHYITGLRRCFDELEGGLRARPYHPTSAQDLTNALVVEWEQIPAARSQQVTT